MFNELMYKLGSSKSNIRELHDFGMDLQRKSGKESVFDFSIGSPSVPTPARFTNRLIRLLESDNPVALHAYTSDQGAKEVRDAVARDLNLRFGTALTGEYIYMTCGAAAAVAIALKAICKDGDEVILLSPYFPEYEVYVRAADAIPIKVGFTDGFDIDFDSLKKAMSERTRALIIDSPNNPSGKVYSAETIDKLLKMLDEHQKRMGIPVYVISDEPYREIVFDDCEPVCILTKYDNAIMAYSFSKSLSLPGERIGYIALNPQAYEAYKLYQTMLGAARALGFICAPTLFQFAVADCLDLRPDVSTYKANRDLLYNELSRIGYECYKPEGTFYMLVKCPGGDACAFSDLAKNYGLLLVPGDDFDAFGYVRIAFCVETDMIKRSIGQFEKLYKQASERLNP